ncbi:MAG: polyphosphate kinase 2 family protein [Thaumarchaeota archaeon]|nr:polyphosphate kinase 2 family protein [Nitrososphaerota archaeon]
MSREVKTKGFRVSPGAKVRLDDVDPADTSQFDGSKSDGLEGVRALIKRLDPLQELLYAEHKHSVLVVLQAMDTGGKDGTIRRVFEGVNPQGVKVTRFGVPTPEESGHDFLWRVHSHAPEKGEMAIFNRSHYESVLVERVHGLVPKEVWRPRYGEINDFERELTEEGTTIVKFYLHISKKEQVKRLQDRLDDPTKHWKFSMFDVRERKFWDQYMKAYEDALERTSTPWAPWYVVPSNHPWFRDLVISTILVKMLEDLKMHYPKLDKAKMDLGQ